MKLSGSVSKRTASPSLALNSVATKPVTRQERWRMDVNGVQKSGLTWGPPQQKPSIQLHFSPSQPALLRLNTLTLTLDRWEEKAAAAAIKEVKSCFLITFYVDRWQAPRSRTPRPHRFTSQQPLHQEIPLSVWRLTPRPSLSRTRGPFTGRSFVGFVRWSELNATQSATVTQFFTLAGVKQHRPQLILLHPNRFVQCFGSTKDPLHGFVFNIWVFWSPTDTPPPFSNALKISFFK